MPRTTRRRAPRSARETRARAKVNRLERLVDEAEQAAVAKPDEVTHTDAVSKPDTGLEVLLEQTDIADDLKMELIETVKQTNLVLERKNAVPQKGIFTELHDQLHKGLMEQYEKQSRLAAILVGLSRQETGLMENAAVNLATRVKNLRSSYDGDSE